MNFLVGFMFLLSLYDLKILKLKGSERSPSSRPSTSKESGSDVKEKIMNLHFPKTFKKEKKKNKWLEDSDNRENQETDEWSMSDRVKKFAKEAMLAKQIERQTPEEHISQCLSKLEKDAEEFVNHKIIESRSINLFNAYMSEILELTHNEFKRRLEYIARYIEKGNHLEAGNFVDLKPMERHMKRLMKELSVAVNTYFYILRGDNKKELPRQFVALKNKLYLFSSDLIDHRDVKIFKKLSTVLQKNHISKADFSNLKYTLFHIKYKLLHLSSMKQEIKQNLTQVLLKYITEGTLDSVYDDIAIFYKYRLRHLKYVLTLKRKHMHYYQNFKKYKEMSITTKRDIHVLWKLYTDKINCYSSHEADGKSAKNAYSDLIERRSQQNFFWLMFDLNNLYITSKMFKALENLSTFINKLLKEKKEHLAEESFYAEQPYEINSKCKEMLLIYFDAINEKYGDIVTFEHADYIFGTITALAFAIQHLKDIQLFYTNVFMVLSERLAIFKRNEEKLEHNIKQIKEHESASGSIVPSSCGSDVSSVGKKFYIDTALEWILHNIIHNVKRLLRLIDAPTSLNLEINHMFSDLGAFTTDMYNILRLLNMDVY